MERKLEVLWLYQFSFSKIIILFYTITDQEFSFQHHRVTNLCLYSQIIYPIKYSIIYVSKTLSTKQYIHYKSIILNCNYNISSNMSCHRQFTVLFISLPNYGTDQNILGPAINYLIKMMHAQQTQNNNLCHMECSALQLWIVH